MFDMVKNCNRLGGQINSKVTVVSKNYYNFKLVLKIENFNNNLHCFGNLLRVIVTDVMFSC